MAKVTKQDVRNAEQWAAAEEKAAKAAERRAKSAQFELDYAEKRHSLSASGIKKDEYRKQWMMTQKRKEEEEQITKEKKRQISQDKRSRNLAKDYSKFLKSNTGTLLQQLKIADSDNNMAKAARGYARDAADESLKADKEKNLAAQEAYNIAQDARKEAMVAIEAGEFEGIDYVNDLTTRLENIEGLDPKIFNELTGSAQKFGDSVDDIIESAGGGEDFARKMELSKESLNAIDGFEEKVFKIKSFITDPQFRSVLMKGFFIGLAVKAATALVDTLVSAYDTMRELGISFSSMPITAGLAKEQAEALVDEFGTLEGVTNKQLIQMKMMSYWYGVSATDSAKLMKLQMSITDSTQEMALDRQAKFMDDLRKSGLSASKVMNDMASHSEYIAKYMKDGGKNMEDAAKQAASMGLDLGVAESMADKLLDYESSIAAEMEASAVLGRSINLDRARQLAFTGQHKEMLQEVKNLAGGEAEFAAMNVAQRDALGEAIGLNAAQMAELVKEQERSTAEQEKGASAILMGVAAGALLGAVLGALAVGFGAALWGSLTFGTAVGAAVKGGMKGLGKGMTKGALKGGSKGALIGGIGGGGIAAYQNRERGGPVRAGNPYIVGEKRPELFIPSVSGNILPNVPRMAEGTGFIQGDMSQTNAKLDKLAVLLSIRNEQAESQTRRNIRATEGAFTQR